MSFRYLIYDIETIVDKRTLNRVVYPGLGLSDDEAFARELAALEAEQPGRTFINPSFHQPVSIVAMAVNANFEIQKIAVLADTERTVEARVRKFWSIVEESHPILVDFNGKGFDLRVLELWAYRLGIALPERYLDKFGPRYRFSFDAHLDLSEFLTNHGAIRLKGGLNLFAKLLGCPGKLDVKGDHVQALYDANDHQVIDDYCMRDVVDSYFVFLRVQVMRGLLSLDAERERVLSAKAFIEKFSKETGYLASYLAHFQPV